MEDMIQPVEQALIFTMVISMGNQLIPAHVYYARQSDNTTFTRVVLHQGDPKAERTIDVDRTEDGWIDLYECEPSPWSALVGPSLDFHIGQNAKS